MRNVPPSPLPDPFEQLRRRAQEETAIYGRACKGSWEAQALWHAVMAETMDENYTARCRGQLH